MKVWYINLLERSRDRRAYMEEQFSREQLIRIDAIDGFDWSEGRDEYTRPEWRPGCREEMLDRGILHRDCTLPPTYVACNLSHEKAVKKFLSSGDEWGIILEDDVEYSDEALESGKKLHELVSIPDGCDMFYLCSADHPGRRLLVQEDGQVKGPRTLMGYALSRHGAERFLEALRPIVHLSDFQCAVRCFESFTGYEHNWFHPDMPILEKIRACALPTGGVIRHSHFAEMTTFSENGKKDWMREDKVT